MSRLSRGGEVEHYLRAAFVGVANNPRSVSKIPRLEPETLPAFQTDTLPTLRDQLKDFTVHALATLRALLDDPNTPPVVRFRIATAILKRPQFPKPGWNLPEPVLGPGEEEFLRNFACMEADYKAMRYRQALNANRENDRENETK